MANSRQDTSLGGGQRQFPDTTWGMLSSLVREGKGQPAEALGQLCHRYWKPVYYYLRVAAAKSNEEAKDLAQSFFLWLMESGTLQRYLPERGSFRTFLKVILHSFVGHQDRAARMLKRGGGVKTLSLDAEAIPSDDLLLDKEANDPEKTFDQAWLTTLMDRAVEAVRAKLREAGRTAALRVFEEHDLTNMPEPPSYAEVAHLLGIKASQVRDHLAAVRCEVQKEIRAELARTAADPDDLEREWNELFGT